MFHIGSVSLAVETVQPLALQCNNCWYHFTSHGKLVIARLGSHRSFSVVLGHWQVKVRHWGLGGPDDWLLPLAVRRDSCPMLQSNPQTFNSTKRSEPLLHILLFLWDSPPKSAHKDIRCSATSWIIELVYRVFCEMNIIMSESFGSFTLWRPVTIWLVI